MIVLGGLPLPSLFLIALLVYGTGHPMVTVETPADLVVQVAGRQFHWDLH